MGEGVDVVIKGAGEVASGVAHYLFSKGLRVVMTEISEPTTQRRTVAFAEAIFSEEIEVEGVRGKKAGCIEDIFKILGEGMIPVLVDPKGRVIGELNSPILVDGIMAKRNLGTKKDDANLVIGLGPGFTAGEDVNAVVETDEEAEVGKVIWEGSARPNTSVPCEIEGYTSERVLRAPTDGIFVTDKKISDEVQVGERVGGIAGKEVKAGISGTVRGIIKDRLKVTEGQKLGDIDPRGLKDFGISDRSLMVGKGVWKVINEFQ